MKKGPSKVEPRQFLSGWKEIADYLGKGVRTVQRYELQMGLPIRRPAGKSRGSVIGIKAELDGWVKASPIHEFFPLRGATPETPSPAQEITRGLSELAQIRQQMSTLRAEHRKSMERLQGSVYALQGELGQRRLNGSSPLYSPMERDLLDSSLAAFAAAPTKYAKPS